MCARRVWCGGSESAGEGSGCGGTMRTARTVRTTADSARRGDGAYDDSTVVPAAVAPFACFVLVVFLSFRFWSVPRERGANETNAPPPRTGRAIRSEERRVRVCVVPSFPRCVCVCGSSSMRRSAERCG